MSPNANPNIEVEAGVAADGGHPFVAMRWGSESGQLTPGEAAAFGMRVIESAIEAERDAGFVAFFREAEYEDGTINALLGELRRHRQQHRVEGFDQPGQP